MLHSHLRKPVLDKGAHPLILFRDLYISRWDIRISVCQEQSDEDAVFLIQLKVFRDLNFCSFCMIGIDGTRLNMINLRAPTQ